MLPVLLYFAKFRAGTTKKWKGEGEGRVEGETLVCKPQDSGKS